MIPRILFVFALLSASAAAHADQSAWLWWGATNPIPVSAANPLPVTPIGGGSGMLTSGSNATAAALGNIVTLATGCNDVTKFVSGTGTCVTLAAGGAMLTNASNATGAAVGNLFSASTGLTASAVAVTSAGGVASFSTTLPNGLALGTPASGVATNLSGTAPSLTAGTVTTNANLTGDVTSVGNATTLASVIAAGGPTGSATIAPIITYDAKGRLTTVSSATITPAVGSITGLGTGVSTALGVNVGSAGALVTNGGALGTPSSGVGTNLTGTAANFTAGHVTTNANLTGPITSSGNATSIASQTGTGTKFVVDTSPSLVTPALGVATATSLAIGGATLGTNGLAVTGHLLLEGVTSTGASGTGNLVFDGSPTLTTPAITQINGPASANLILNAGASGSGVFSVNGVTAWNWGASAFYPNNDGGSNMGGTSNRFGTVYGIAYNSGASVMALTTTGLSIAGLATSSAAKAGTLCAGSSTGGTITVDTTVACLSSDERLKTIAGPMTGALDEVMKLRPIVYEWKPGTPRAATDTGPHIGLGAFATAYADERLVARDTEGNPRGWRQDAMIAMLVAAIQEQQREIAALKAR